MNGYLNESNGSRIWVWQLVVGFALLTCNLCGGNGIK
jgi:hypothetical protein